MNILSWNCRGLGNPWTIRDLCQLTKEKNPNLVFLMETKLRRKKMELIRCKLVLKTFLWWIVLAKGGGGGGGLGSFVEGGDRFGDSKF
jgi:exonuclease III